MGAAYSAEEGSETVWWNPAGIARLTKPELRLDHFATFLVESGDAVALILPAGPVGAFGISARLFNYGTSPATDRTTGAEVGVSTQRSYTLGGTFATAFGPLWNAGIAFRLYSLGSPCTGLCTNTVSGSFNTATVDVGAKYRLSASSPIELGATLSNLGPDLQVHDRPQADALPARIRLGAGVQIPTSQWDPNLRVRVTADFVATPALSSQELHAGGELSYSSAGTSLFARAGYVHSDAASAGPSIGFGLSNARLQLDFARVFESFSTGLGKPPTYISIRIGL